VIISYVTIFEPLGNSAVTTNSVKSILWTRHCPRLSCLGRALGTPGGTAADDVMLGRRLVVALATV